MLNESNVSPLTEQLIRITSVNIMQFVLMKQFN